MTEKKKTFGQEYNEVQAAATGTQEVRETTNEMGRDYMKSLNKVTEAHKHLREPYYILEVLKPEAFLQGVIKLTHIARKTRPRPEWGLALYKVDNVKGRTTYEWGLPKAEEAYIMMQAPEGWDPKLVRDIRDFLAGTLV